MRNIKLQWNLIKIDIFTYIQRTITEASIGNTNYNITSLLPEFIHLFKTNKKCRKL